MWVICIHLPTLSLALLLFTQLFIFYVGHNKKTDFNHIFSAKCILFVLEFDLESLVVGLLTLCYNCQVFYLEILLLLFPLER